MKLFLLFLITVSQLFSAPAFTKTREFTNADGTTFMAKAQGNQHLNWIQTLDGEILKYNTQTKNYEYAKIENKQLQATGVIYEVNNSKRARSIGKINKLERSEVGELWREKQELHHVKVKGLER